MSNIVEFTYKLTDRISGSLVNIAKSATNVAVNMQKTQNGFDNAARSAQKLNAKMNPLQAGFDGLIKRGVAFFGIMEGVRAGGAFIGLGMNMEETRAKFEVLLGTAEKGNKMISNLNKMADITPFENEDLIKNSETMLAFGINAKKILPTLSMIGDVSMGNKEKLQGLTLAYSQVASTGRLMGQDLLQMINQGFNPLLIMSQKTGKSMAQLKDDMEKGKISFAMVENAFKTATAEGGQFHGMMDKMSETGKGKLSTFMGNLKAKLTEVAERLNPLIVNVMNFAIGVVANFDTIAGAIWTILKPIRAFFLGLSTIFNYFRKNKMALAEFAVITTIYSIAVWSATLATKGWTIATQLQYYWLLLVEKAQKLMSMTNPYLAIVAGITLVVGALMMMRKNTKEAASEYGELNKKAAAYGADERSRLDTIFDKLRATNPQSKERNKLVKELQDMYPEYVKNMGLEKAGLEDLEKAYTKIVAAIDRKARAQAVEDELTDLYKITGENERDARERAEKENKETFATWKEEQNSTKKTWAKDSKNSTYKLPSDAKTVAVKKISDADLYKAREEEFYNKNLWDNEEKAGKYRDAKTKIEKLRKYALGQDTSTKNSSDTGNDTDYETGGTGKGGKKSGGKVGDLTGGGSRATNVTINLRNLIENYNLHTENFKEGVDQGTQVLIEALLRVVNSSNKIVTQ